MSPISRTARSTRQLDRDRSWPGHAGEYSSVIPSGPWRLAPRAIGDHGRRRPVDRTRGGEGPASLRRPAGRPAGAADVRAGPRTACGAADAPVEEESPASRVAAAPGHVTTGPSPEARWPKAPRPSARWATASRRRGGEDHEGGGRAPDESDTVLIVKERGLAVRPRERARHGCRPWSRRTGVGGRCYGIGGDGAGDDGAGTGTAAERRRRWASATATRPIEAGDGRRPATPAVGRPLPGPGRGAPSSGSRPRVGCRGIGVVGVRLGLQRLARRTPVR
jgi:hypothetical protein